MHNHTNCFKKIVAIIIAISVCSGLVNAAVIQHNIGTGNLIIPGNSTNDYIITGSTSTYYIEVGLGYHGTITLQNCNFNFTGWGVHSPIRIVGRDGQSNENPLTIVNLILDGSNTIQNDGGGRACIQVDQGTQINISAIDPCDDNSGTLIARQLNDDGGAAIGSLNHWNNSNEPTATATLYNQNGSLTGYNGTTAGGNVVVSSGKLTVRGGHGAGIGGGFGTYYDGMIVIYGGVVEATADFDAAGVGSGCPEGTGVIQVYAPHSAVVALPPATISAKGAGASPNGGIGHTLFSELGLSGTKVRVYIGDPGMTNCPINISTEDNTPNANIYVDLSQDPDINRVVTATVDPALLDIHQVYFGTTNSSGMYSTTGKLQNNTTFFTDAISASPESYGHPYLPKVMALPYGGNIHLQRLMADFTIESFPSSPLFLGYSSMDASLNAACVKLVYNDADPIEDVQFDLANGNSTDFDNLIFLASDSTTVISAPTTLTQGDSYYILIPIKTGKGAYIFSDVVRIIGVWQGTSTSYIRQIVTQIVGDMHTEYICQGESYWYNGEELTEPGLYSSVTTTTSQCNAVSSVEFLNLIVTAPVTSMFNANACDSYDWNGIVYTETGYYSQTLQTVFGCDSVVTMQLTINPSYTTNLTVTACDEYEWFGETYYNSGQYTHMLNSIYGCDSLFTMNLTINNSPDLEIHGLTQIAISTDLWPGIYNYCIADSVELQPCTVTWECSNPDWIVLPSDNPYWFKLIANTLGTATLTAVADCQSGCNATASIEIQASYIGVDEIDDNPVSIYPNPASDRLIIKGEQLKQIIIYNCYGQTINVIPMNLEDEISIETENMDNGLYFADILTTKGIITKRILISK